MSDPLALPPTPALQFDRAVSATKTAAAGVTCSRCGTVLADSYFTLAQKIYCASCKAAVEQAVAATLTPRAFVRALAFGLAAAVAGAIVYYAVIAILDIEIGIVAILIGYMVGYGIRKALRGGGGRRYQILGASLTYLAVGMAYMPVAIGGAGKRTAEADSLRVVRHDSAANKAATSGVTRDSATSPDVSVLDSAVAPAARRTSIITGLGLLLFFVLALPVTVVVGSMPSGLISAAIISFGMMQAWKMTAAPMTAFAGPLKVAPPPPPPSTNAAQG